jgi:curved DNA-binding protein CbpA
MVPPLVAVALDHYRDPTAFEHLRDPSLALPEGFPRMLGDFSGVLAAGNLEDTAAQLSVEPAELQVAARFLIRHLLLDAPEDYYRCLGVSRDAPANLIKAHYLLLNRLLHPDRLPAPNELDLQYARRLNQAYHVLNDPEARARYDDRLGTRTRARRPSDPRVFFRRRQAIGQDNAAREPVTAASSPPGPRRFVFRGALLVMGATLLLWVLLPMLEPQSALSSSSAGSGQRAQAPGPEGDTTADRAPSPPTTGSLAVPDTAYGHQGTSSAAANAPQRRGPEAAQPEGGMMSRGASAALPRDNPSPLPLSSGASATPSPPAGHQTAPESSPVVRRRLHAEDDPSLDRSADRFRSEPGPKSAPGGADSVTADIQGPWIPDAESTPTQDRAFPLIEFEPPRYPAPLSQPAGLNP